MTVYEINYKNRLDEMMNAIIRKYGFEHERTIMFATYYEKLYNQATYDNREFMEKMFKGWMK